MKRIGHMGAHLIERGNTAASFDAALNCNVDMTEFDVIRWRGRLVVAHDSHDAAAREVMTLEEGLDHFPGILESCTMTLGDGPFLENTATRARD